MAFISTLQEPSFRYKLATLSLLSIIVGMFASRALMSIGMILIGLQFFLKPDIKQTLRLYYQDKVLFILSFIFFSYFTTIFYTEHMEAFWPRLMIKLPLLFMPLGFSALKEMPVKYFQHVLFFFLFLAFLNAVFSTGMYLINYTEITENYKYAKVIPNLFQINHIRYSLMLVMAIFSGYYLFREKYFLFSPKERYFIVFAAVFILAFIHLLSVRSGLLAFYASCFVIAISYTFLYKKYLLGSITIALIILMPFIAYKTVPTITNKVDYMITDVSRFIKGENANQWSDGNRLLSIGIGIRLGLTSPLTGIGIGDVEKEMNNYYSTYHSEIWEVYRLIPHNQFVYVFTACGLIGVAIFSFVTLYPFFLSATYKNLMFLSVLVTIFTSYISEATLENQLGVCLFVTFYLIGWSCRSQSKTDIA